MDRNTPFVNSKWLHEHLQEATLRLIDCRFVLGKPDAGREAYEAGHIPGAYYAHLEQDLSAPVGAHGGRHPLPSVDQFAAFLSRAGITEDTHVVAYDDFGEMAARLWWLIRYFGHERVTVLQGGFSAWRASGYPLEMGASRTTAPAPIRSLAPKGDMLVSRDEVKRLLEGDRFRYHLADARALPRYRGELEPLDPKAGHIPSAQCFHWEKALVSAATWHEPTVLRAHFRPLLDGRDIIAYCGSGVTACPNVLALHSIGVSARLYAGSWSDWCSYPDSPIAVGDEPVQGEGPSLGN